jgi:hypothetical protein
MFTVNLKVVARPTWDAMCSNNPRIGPKPSPNNAAGGDEWLERIGFLMPNRDDKWWVVSRDRPTDDLAGEVMAAIDAYAIPAMLERLQP